ncbi:hypothetical protein OJ997_16005 [Solirubrobacter phytolaccae]|uniref:Uncharacterized protein n=1 Tax=Solirubrobacter phytolaccae TaxID=1404360 RepID=A0A9X3NBP4_9ACTN|nr:hypothetical protein [Solirubrobacter phytolaccae]MDA0181807.1 hypothetical protein [Solirubrobacter phytolaccae]
MSHRPDETSLTPDERRSWRSFVELHDEGRRTEALTALDALVTSLGGDDARRDRFAEALAVAWIDPLEPGEHAPTLLRHPLWQRVLLPHLERRVDSADGARRLGIVLATGSVARTDLDERDLLRRAAEQETVGTQSRRWLLDTLLKDLEYAFHELPAGVLAEPEELESDADWLQRLASELQREDELRPVVDYVRQHAAASRAFRRRTDRSVSYAALLEALAIEWRDAPAPLR